MIERDPQARWTRLRQLPTAVRTEMLIGENWSVVAEMELLRLELEAASLCHQLADRPGVEKLTDAVAGLKAARAELLSSSDNPRYLHEELGRRAGY